MYEPKLFQFQREVEKLINKLGIDSELNIPDFFVAEYLFSQLKNLQMLLEQRDRYTIPTNGDTYEVGC